MTIPPDGPSHPVSLAAYAEARTLLHYANLLVSAVGKDLLPPRADASHKSLVYEPAERSFMTPTVDSVPVRAAVRPHDFQLLVHGPLPEDESRLALTGRTLDQAESWLNDRIRDLWPDASPPVTRSRYEDLAPHDVGAGGAFPAVDPHALEAVERHFALTRSLLEDVRAALPRSSPIRIWPHHFDEAVLIPLDDSDGEHARSIGVGFSPGDASRMNPYWYVTAWPPPDRLPQGNTIGRWQAEPFFGTTLEAQVNDTPTEDAALLVRRFFASAIGTAKESLVSP